MLAEQCVSTSTSTSAKRPTTIIADCGPRSSQGQRASCSLYASMLRQHLIIAPLKDEHEQSARSLHLLQSVLRCHSVVLAQGTPTSNVPSPVSSDSGAFDCSFAVAENDVRSDDSGIHRAITAVSRVVDALHSTSTSIKSVETFLDRVMKMGGNLALSCVDIACILLQRLRSLLVDATRTLCECGTVTPVADFVIPNQMVCRAAAAAMIVAIKLHCDDFPSMSVFAGMWGVQKRALCRHERDFLIILEYNVHVSPAEYLAFQVAVISHNNASVVRKCTPFLPHVNDLQKGQKQCTATAESVEELDDDAFISEVSSSVQTPRLDFTSRLSLDTLPEISHEKK